MGVLTLLMVDADALQIPSVEAADAFIYLDGVAPAETMELAHVGEFLERSVWLGGIPPQLSLETYFLHNALCYLSDRDFLACTYVDVAVAYFLNSVAIDNEVALLDNIFEIDIEQAVNGGICHLFAPKEFTHGGACSPKGYGFWRDAIVA